MEKQSSSAIQRMRVVGALSLAASIAYLCRHPLGVAESTISDELGLNSVQSGILLGAFFWSYAICQIPGGWLGHTVGNRLALSGFTVAGSLGMLLTGVSSSFVLMLNAQVLMGAAQAGLFPCSALVIQRWLPIRQRAMGQGCVGAGMQLGGIVTAGLTGWLLAQHISWRWVFAFYALPGVLWAVVFLLRFDELPASADEVDSAQFEEAAEENLPFPWKAVLLRPTMWCLCAQQSARAAGYIFFATWFPSFIQHTQDVSIEKSGWLQAGLLLAAMVGGLAGGFLADRLFRRLGGLRKSRAILGAGGPMVCGVLILAAYLVGSPELAVVFLIAGSFFAAVGGPSATSVAIDIGGKHVAKVFAIMNMSGNLAAALCPVVVGWVFSRTENWSIVLVLFACLYFLAAACWLVIDPTQDVTASAETSFEEL